MTTGWAATALVLTGLLVPARAEAAIPYDTEITPGELRGIAYAPGDPWLYGYWEYLPTNFDEYAPGSLPLLVFLPGIGEYDDVSSCPGGTDLCMASDCGSDGLCRNLTWGPQQLIRLGQWDDVLRPFIVISPQHQVPPFNSAPWDIDRLDDFFQFVVDNYPVDERRLYLIGMSQGGRGVLQYTQAHSRRFAAVAPTPGGTVDPYASCYFQDTALWVFHGEDDADGHLGPGVFSPCSMVGLAYQYDNPGLYVGSAQCQAIVGDPRPPGRLTMYYNVAHFAWVPTVDPINSGFGANEWASDQGCGIPATFREYSAALDSDGVYSWFLSLDRPRVEAPADMLVDQPEISLTATITDDDPVTIAWTQTGGPPVMLADADTDTLDVAGLAPSEQYTFQIYVVDADQQWDLDEVIVTTDSVLGGGGSSSSGGGAESTDGGEGSSSSGPGPGGTTDGGATTSAGDGTASEDGPPSDTTVAGGTTGDGPGDTGPSAEGTTGGASGVGSEGGSEGSGPGAADGGDSSGCGCRSDSRSGGSWAWALVLLAARRRRSRAQ